MWIDTITLPIAMEAFDILSAVAEALDANAAPLVISAYPHDAPPSIPVGAEEALREVRQRVATMLVREGILQSATYFHHSGPYVSDSDREGLLIEAAEAPVRSTLAALRKRLEPAPAGSGNTLPKSQHDALPNSGGALPKSQRKALPRQEADPHKRPAGGRSSDRRAAKGARSDVTRVRTGLDLLTAHETYTLQGQLGQGGSGAVWAARSEQGGTVAIKILDPTKSRKEVRARFRNEMSFCEGPHHPHVIRSLDRGFHEIGGQRWPFYVMPLYPHTLRTVMRAGLGHEQRLSIFAQVLDGMEHAHEQGVIHRDLKPENILVSNGYTHAVVADFGIAKFDEDMQATVIATLPEERLANFQYAAPEQRRVGDVTTSATDVYALGLILNELFTGDVPQGQGHLLVADIAPEYAYLDALVETMIQNVPANRLQSAAEVKARMGLAERTKGATRQPTQRAAARVVSEARPERSASSNDVMERLRSEEAHHEAVRKRDALRVAVQVSGEVNVLLNLASND
jgi:serine/threonine protein kinase